MRSWREQKHHEDCIRRAWVQELADTGKTLSACARWADVTVGQLSQMSRRYGVKFAESPAFANRGRVRDREIKPLLAAGMTKVAIADHFNVTPSAIYYAIRRIDQQSAPAEPAKPLTPLEQMEADAAAVNERLRQRNRL